ncbi:Uncharacterised protein [Shigella sonnei]|nr:Uncharacterised protein [Shigella sonnei]CSE44993.1 Uncharacterised protein [Shigella sonnei]CSE61581.1 Uncharacterised protein [Shigella sonnei]CSF00005.1 Uncharacterised protein [Shigella sonnei]CSF14582.1 Uncharacterised protein [Shigella sonnei]
MRFVENRFDVTTNDFPHFMKWRAAAHGGENIAFKLADLPFFGDIREGHYQVLQMREHVINRADRGFNPDFFTGACQQQKFVLIAGGFP